MLVFFWAGSHSLVPFPEVESGGQQWKITALHGDEKPFQFAMENRLSTPSNQP